MKEKKKEFPILHVDEVNYERKRYDRGSFGGNPLPPIAGEMRVTIKARPGDDFTPATEEGQVSMFPDKFRMDVRRTGHGKNPGGVWTCIKGNIPREIVDAILAAHKFYRASGLTKGGEET
jgi:hypothetical protein